MRLVPLLGSHGSPGALLSAQANQLLVATPSPEAKKTQSLFIAPCCWQESVAVHRSPVANEMRAEIEEMVGAGKSEAEIIEFYVARYGGRILIEPRGAPSFWLRFIPMAAISAATAALICFLVQRGTTTIRTETTAATPQSITDEELE